MTRWIQRLWNLIAYDWRRPPAEPPQPDYEAIARLERELGMLTSLEGAAQRPERPLCADPVCLTKGCDGGTELRLWSGMLARRVHDHG